MTYGEIEAMITSGHGSEQVEAEIASESAQVTDEQAAALRALLADRAARDEN